MTETAATTGSSTGSVETKAADDSVPTGAAQDQEAATSAAPEVPEEPDADQPEPEPPASPSFSPNIAPPPPPTGPPAAGGGPTFTRPPGMTPPPETLEDEQAVRRDTTASMPAAVGVPSSPVLSGPPRPTDTSASGSFPVVSASAPVSAPPRATGRTATSGVTMRPIGPTTAPPGAPPGAQPGAPPGAPAVGAARVTEAVRPSRQSATTPRGPRRARLSVKRIDPWSVMKFSFAVSLVLFIVVIVAASVLYLALDSMGVFTSINETVADLVESGGGEGETFRITAQGVIGSAAVLGALNVLLFTSLATLGAFIYNVCADLVGGVEVTLAERD